MADRSELVRQLERLAEPVAPRRLPDPSTLRRAADRRGRRRIAVVAVCAAVGVVLPVAVAAIRHDREVQPVDNAPLTCAQRPSGWARATMYEFDETRPADPGWRQTHPPVPPGHHVMYLAAAGNSAGYVVVGRTYAGNPGPTFHDDRSWLWYSHDGRSWQRYAQSEIGTFGQDLLATGDRFYSPGSTADGSPAVWSSADGLHWKPAVVEAPSSPPLPSETASVWVSRLSCDDDQLIATGAEHGRPLIWTSPDGTHWTRRDWADPEVSALTLRRWPGTNAYGPVGTVAMAPRGDGWAPHSVWFHAPLHP